jgi:hypothetical protein
VIYLGYEYLDISKWLNEMAKYTIWLGCPYRTYPLAISRSYGESPFLIGKSSKKTSINGPFSMAMWNNQRVYHMIIWCLESWSGQYINFI